MIEIRGLFETHLTVADLDRSVAFYRDTLGLPLAIYLAERRVAFFWIGPAGHAMLGLWETGGGPPRMSLHTAFTVDLEGLLQAVEALKTAGLTAGFSRQTGDRTCCPRVDARGQHLLP